MSHSFEQAAVAVMDGDLATLTRLLDAEPALATRHSSREHGATLLHYNTANAVEDQRTPPNAVAVAELLLARGADPNAPGAAYGGGPNNTPLVWLVTSCWPHLAGVQAELVRVYCRSGALPDGVLDDGAPIMFAIAFRYPKAAAALAECGARVDNLISAAALGRLEQVRGYRTADGWSAEATWLDGNIAKPFWSGRAADPDRAAGLALAYAAMFGEFDVVDYLAGQGVSLCEPTDQGMTALHWAAWYGWFEVADKLLALGAPLEVENAFGGTVLDSTVWGGANSDQVRGHAPRMVRRLLEAGADVTRVTPYPSGNPAVDAVLAEYR